ncbi:MAG: signal peptide peptidase SppA [Bacteroidales bacterium]|nr:signal peptide peptidase SppA [Bacteroidales bacterium]
MEELRNNPEQTRQGRGYQPKPMTFGKTMLASALGFIIVIAIGNILAFVMLVSMIAALGSMSGTQSVTVRDNSFLKIDLTAEISERGPNEVLSFFSEDKMAGLDDILDATRAAATDNRIEGIYLYMGSGAGLSWGMAEELREALLHFGESGKKIMAYADSYSQTGYYVATAADTIMMNPSGLVDFRGIGAEVLFYKDLLDRLGINMQLIRPSNNAYKSAGETYTMDHMSEANREQVRAYISSIWNHVAANMAAARGIDMEELGRTADNLSGCLAADAKQSKLIDLLGFESDMKEMMKEQFDGKHTISATKYAQSIAKPSADGKIAVVYAEGQVLPGKNEGFQTAVYGDDIAQALDKAAADDKVKAIVLRVNSPGGAVTASETMTHAVIRAREKKPVIVSMSDLAASAGYEISSNASYIVAQPTTITGSIGVFATIPDASGLLKRKLGISTDTVMTNRNSAAMSIARPLSPTATALMKRNVEEFYDTFCLRVATGRKLTVAQVDSIARGRCWTGAEALHIGLVDTLGGMDLAMQIAAEKAGLKQYSVVKYPEDKGWQTLLKLTDEESRAALRKLILKEASDPLTTLYDQLRPLTEGEPMQARLPYVITLTR